MKLVAQNKKARHDYKILESFEAGIMLAGTEVKSLREGRANLRDSFALIEDGEVILKGINHQFYCYVHISHFLFWYLKFTATRTVYLS